MPLVRVVDYAANPGGGCRFVAEMLRAFRRITRARFEVVSHGSALDTYQRILGDAVALVDHPPRNALRAFPPWANARGFSGAYALLHLPQFHFDVPQAALAGCDAVWFPWVHRHRLPRRPDARVFGTFHDCISLEFPGVLPERLRRQETKTTQSWLTSSARILATSNATVSALRRIFPGVELSPSVVPLSSKHDAPPPLRGQDKLPIPSGRYLLCPANLSPHKNVEGLLEGFAEWGAKVPLVLTGPGLDLRNAFNAREKLLRAVMERRGLLRDRDVFPLGYLSDPEYYALLDGAWGLVVPTLAEGGGSFPVLEALERGIPVLASDIPVMREMAERWHARLLWFDSRSPADAASKLSLLEKGYDEHRRAAATQVPLLLQRSWEEVAREYAEIMALPRSEITARA